VLRAIGAIGISWLHFAAIPRILGPMLNVIRQSEFLLLSSPSGLLLYLLR
jgi:hypothetical protein